MQATNNGYLKELTIWGVTRSVGDIIGDLENHWVFSCPLDLVMRVLCTDNK